MLVGEPPFTGSRMQVVIAKRFVATPPSVAAVRDGIPRAVATALQRALARSPSDRPQTPGEFARALMDARVSLQGR
jgi:eukaryotic-like serine/threonine-protein kinase